MTRSLALASIVLLSASPAFAQMSGPPQKITLAQGITRAYDGVKRNLTEMAEKMPEADYGYKPHPDSRAFGQLFARVRIAMRHRLEHSLHVGAHALGRAQPVRGRIGIQRQAAIERDQLAHVGGLTQLIEPRVELGGRSIRAE